MKTSTIKEQYTRHKADQIRRAIESQINKGLPIHYEIKVDGIVVVERTDELELFDSYESLVDDQTSKVTIRVFTSPEDMLPGTEYILGMSSERRLHQQLGADDIEKQIAAKVNAELEKRKQEQLLIEAQKELKQAQDRIEELEDELEEEKDKGLFSAKRVGTVGSTLLETFIRNNPDIISRIPGSAALSGFFTESGDLSQNPQQPVSEMSFKEKGSPVMSEKEKTMHSLFEEFEKRFDDKGLSRVNFILGQMLRDPSSVEQIASLFGPPMN